MINAGKPTERSRHIDIQYFAIQDWRQAGDIILKSIPGIINPADDFTKALGWVLHSRHARRLMGHYGYTFNCSTLSIKSLSFVLCLSHSRPGENVRTRFQSN